MIFFKGKPVKQLTAEEARTITNGVKKGIELDTYLFLIETRAKSGHSNLTVGGDDMFFYGRDLQKLGYKVEYDQKEGVYIISW